MGDVQRRLSAIVCADVAGYSRLMGDDEEGTLAALKAIRREVVDPRIERYGGRIVKSTGDGLLLEFPSVVDAVRCAAEVQQVMTEHNAPLPGDRRIEFRVGINLGDIILDEGDIFGDGVNVAARLQETAEPGGVCVSSRVYELVRDRLDLRFQDDGEHHLKNISRPVRVFSLGGSGRAGHRLPITPMRAVAGLAILAALVTAGWWLWTQAPTSSSAQQPTALVASPPANFSMIVLPFSSYSSDGATAHLVDAITEGLTTSVSQITWLSVVARNTAFTYKGKHVDIKQLGRDLGVRYVLEGSAMRYGDRLRINAQLIDAETGVHAWAQQIDEDAADPFALQDRLAARLTRTLVMEIREAEIRRAMLRSAEHEDAATLIRRGQSVFYRAFTRDNVAAAIELAERARAIDPQNEAARGNLAWYRLCKVINGWSADREGDLRFVAAHLDQASQTDSRNPGLLTVKGWLAHIQGQHGAAVEILDQAAEARPSAATLANAGYVRIMADRTEEAVDLVLKALRLNPEDPFVYLFQNYLATAHLWLGQDQAALPWLERSSARNPRYEHSHLFLASAYAQLGRIEEARSELAAALAINSDLSLGRIRSILPATNPKAIAGAQRYLEGLRTAGLSE